MTATLALAAWVETTLVVLAVALAAGYVLRRAIRTFAPKRGGCGCAGTPACPATNAAGDLRVAARRALGRPPDARRRTAR
jgi:hypothetical protein